MNTLSDILQKYRFHIFKKDRKGTFHWVESVKDIDTAEARLRQLSAVTSNDLLFFVKATSA